MNVILDQQFREVIKAALAEQGLSRAELARRMNVSHVTVSLYLNGKISPGVGVIEKFCDALGLEPRLEVTVKKIPQPA
jgi:transcriptional regulator with XRE-family HTH domain